MIFSVKKSVLAAVLALNSAPLSMATYNVVSCASETSDCGPSNPCGGGLCCSQWGFCGSTEAHCGACCQSNCWAGPNTPSPTTASPTSSLPTSPIPTTPRYTADHGEDSRLIAYVANWLACPTDAQVDAYSHMVIAFSVSYTWTASKNQCDAQCNIGTSVAVCDNVNNQDLVDKWRGMGKKVILSFGGAGMGGSWSGDTNNCWDYCFGKEESLSTSLVDIVKNQHFDGIDIDYEYCYDLNGLQSGLCAQRSTLYSDSKAQTFLDILTAKLRVKLDALQQSNGYNRGRYELTHAPMDTDISRQDSKYYQILKNRRHDLDFLMPQFYNGVTRPGVDGLDGTGAGSMSAAKVFGSLANDLFAGEPNKVVFGFCVSDCSGSGSNVNKNQARQVLSDLKAYNGGEFSCNGGAFFWVSSHDTNGSWSNTVLSEVSLTSGCSNPLSTSSTSMLTTEPTLSPTLSKCIPTGRKLRIHSLFGQPIHIFEVRVISSGRNVAKGKTATQSSTFKGFIASNAIDGNRNSFSHTNEASFAWWEIDLGGDFPVESVNILNRYCGSVIDLNGCLCRLSHAAVTLVDQQGKWVAAELLGDTCGKLEVETFFRCSL